MTLASDFGTGQVFLSMLWFFLFFMWIMLVFRVFGDIFRDQETGGGTSAPVYERIARVVFKDKPPVPFRVPPGIKLVSVNPSSGTRASGPGSILEAFKPDTEPSRDVASSPSCGKRAMPIEAANSA